jgi:hypothetical protein
VSSIDKVIDYLENGKRDPEGPQQLYDMIDELKNSPYYYVRFWDQMNEYHTPKMTRSGYQANTNVGEETIKIITVDGHTGNAPIQED